MPYLIVRKLTHATLKTQVKGERGGGGGVGFLPSSVEIKSFKKKYFGTFRIQRGHTTIQTFKH